MRIRALPARRAVAGGAALALVAALTTAVGAQEAGAVSFAGRLSGHGVGSVFASSGQLLTQSIASAGTATYTFNVTNTGSVPAQYLVRVSHSGNALVTVKTGSVDVTYSAMSDGWYTNVIPAGKLIPFTVAFKVPVGSPPYEDDGTISLNTTSGSQLSGMYTATYIKALLKGSSGADIFVKGTNGQFVGGPSYAQVACSTVLKAGTKTAFTIQLQNDSTAPSQIVFSIYDAQGNRPVFPLKVVYGTSDQTSTVFGSAWVSPVLKPGAHVTLTVTASNTGAIPFNGQGNIYELDSYDNLSSTLGSTQYIEVNGAV